MYIEKDPKVNYTFISFIEILRTKEVRRQTQHFRAIHQCAACVVESEPKSGIFYIEV